MKQINKSSEPASLVQHRASSYSSYDNLPTNTKEELRNSLLSEQGYICCYCMKRIPEKINVNRNISYDMKIEHHQCQDRYPNLQLNYNNLLSACMGNEGKPKKLQTCDTKKGNLDLAINPLSCETLFKYNADGEISSVSNDNEINRQINEVLNLNMQTLKDNRKQVYLEVQKKVKIESKNKKDKQLKKKYFEQERDKWLSKNQDGKFQEYCMVAVYCLNKKIKANS